MFTAMHSRCARITVLQLFLFFVYSHTSAQVGVGTATPHASAALEVRSAGKGLLIPRTDSAGIAAIASPAKGLMVYDTARAAFMFYGGAGWSKVGGNLDASVQNGRVPVGLNGALTGSNIYATNGGNIGIGTPSPTEQLVLSSGNLALANSPKGIVLDGSDRPIITRGFDTFTAGSNIGLGRWGLFMEPHRLTAGIPAVSGKGFQVASYNQNGTISKDLITVSQEGNLDVDNEINRTGKTGNADLVPIAYGSVAADGSIRTGTGNFTVSKVFTGIYRIAVNGESLSANNHVIQMTKTTGLVFHEATLWPLTLTPGQPVGTVDFKFFTSSGFGTTGVDHDFFFTIYKP